MAPMLNIENCATGPQSIAKTTEHLELPRYSGHETDTTVMAIPSEKTTINGSPDGPLMPIVRLGTGVNGNTQMLPQLLMEPQRTPTGSDECRCQQLAPSPENNQNQTRAIASTTGLSAISPTVNQPSDMQHKIEMPNSESCTVCGEATKGVYYGAVTCLPCKTFFVRYSGETKKMKCRTGQENCDINEATRVSCKACRYVKCLRAGMKRKERPEKQLPSKGQPTCAVCGDTSNGLHFGVFTCEGCKKFYRRGLEEHTTYTCKNNLQCRMNPKTRNFCRLCRYQRCLEVGMSLKGIRFGRRKKYTDSDVFGTGSNSSGSDELDGRSRSNSSSSGCSSTHNTEPMDLSPAHSLPFIEPSSVPTTFHSPLDLSHLQQQQRPGSVSETRCNTSSSTRGGPPPLLLLPQPNHFVSAQLGSHSGSHSESYPPNSDHDSVRMTYDAPHCNPELRRDSMPLQSPWADNSTGIISAPAQPTYHRQMDEMPHPDDIRYWQQSVPLDVSAITVEQRQLIAELLTLHEPHRMSILNDPASNRITTLPGLLAFHSGNTDDGVIQNITNIVIFAKSLPGFERVHRKDQYTLIRSSSTETRILSSAMYETRSVEEQLQEAYMQKCPTHLKFLKTSLSTSKAIRLLNLDEVETCVLFVLTITATDRHGLVDPATIADIRQKYISALASYIEANNGDAFSRLSAIFSMMPRVRQLGKWYSEFINNTAIEYPKDENTSQQIIGPLKQPASKDVY